MYSTASPPRSGGFLNLLRQIEAWLDSIGRGAWIALMVLGFVFTGPFGLILLAYMIWGKKMFGSSCRHRHNHANPRTWGRDSAVGRPSGNATFDAYKADTLRRLEDEQGAFEAFMQRLREAKDKTEFDSFMEDRAKRPAPTEEAAETAPASADPRSGVY